MSAPVYSLRDTIRRGRTTWVGILCVMGLGLTNLSQLRAEQPELAPPPRLIGSVPVPAPAAPIDPRDRFRLKTDRFHFQRIEDDTKIRSEADNPYEFAAYNEVLLQAHSLSVDELESVAIRDVMFRDLAAEVRKDFQFKIVYLEGRLKRLRRLEPTRPLAEAGIHDLYEGWIFPAMGTEPICVLTTELPPGLEPAVEYSPARPATIAGYSFKLFRYEAADPKDPSKMIVRKAPLLMGKSFRLIPDPPPPDSAEWWGGFLPGLLAVMAGIGAVTLGLAWWFRRGDRQTRAVLEARRDQNPYAEPNSNETNRRE